MLPAQDFATLKAEGRTYQYVTRIILNNNRRDAFNARQCLAYDLLRSVDIHAPPCDFARGIGRHGLGIRRDLT